MSKKDTKDSTSNSFKDLDVLEDLYTQENPTEVNLKRLAELLDIKQKQIAESFHLDESKISKNPYASQNQTLKQWLLIFNLIIKIIGESESELAPTAIKVKMQRWLKMPRPEFDDKSALEFMLKGKTRQVRNILEQRLG